MFSPTIQRFLKYSGIGVCTFLFDLLLLYIFIDVYGIDPLISAGVAFVIAVSVNYVVSRHFVFSGTMRSVGTGYANFIAIASTGLLIVVGGMYVLVEILAIHYAISRIIVAGITGFWNYLMNLYVNFKVAGKH